MSSSEDISEKLIHFVKTFDTIEKIKDQQRDQLKDLREDYKNLEKAIITFLLEKKEKAMKVGSVILLLKSNNKSLTKTEQANVVSQILNDKSKREIAGEELALLLINSMKRKSDEISKYSLKVIQVPT